MKERPDPMPATAGHGHLRVAHFDREQVIGVLKAAFVQGMLGKEEFDLRVGPRSRRGPGRSWTPSPLTCPRD
jgi:hypothetical protein